MTSRRLSGSLAAVTAFVVAVVPTVAAHADTANVPLPVTREWTSPMKHAISISRPAGISLAVRARIRDVASAIGAEAYPGRAAMFGMTRIERNGKSIQRIPSGKQVPMSTTVQPDEVVRNLLTVEAADALAAGGVVIGDSSARFRGAREGDVITEAGQQAVASVADLEARIKEATDAGRKSLLLLVRRAGDPRFVALPLDQQ